MRALQDRKGQDWCPVRLKVVKSAADGYQVGQRPRDFGQPVRCRDAVVDQQFLDQDVAT